jgi:hypothetical protein
MPFSQDRAAKYTNFPITPGEAREADLAVENGNTITVYGIAICHTGREDHDDDPATCLFEEYGTANEILRVELSPGDSYECTVQWLADKGLQVTTDLFYLDCTVWHSQAGS